MMERENTLDDIPAHVYTDIPVPDRKFIKFYGEFDTVSDILKTNEWKTMHSFYYQFDKHELEIDINETVEDYQDYSPERQTQEIIKCVNSFSYFCHKYVKIIHPMHGLIPFILYKYQRRVISDYHSNRFNILSKFRQGGLTTVSVAWALWKCMFQLDQQILVLSKTDREAIAAGEVASKAIEYLPNWMVPTFHKNSAHEKQFSDTGSAMWFYTPEASRGKSITVLIIDEAAFIKDMDKYWKAIYPTISTGGACCVVSTVNGLGNWYEEWYHAAEKDENEFNVIDIDYWEHPDYNDPKWVKDNRANLGDKGWKQEVLRDFLGSGETYISSKILDELDQSTRDNQPERILFRKWANLGGEKRIKWEPGALWIWKEPRDGHEYLMAIDTAEGVGTEGDSSCFQILNMATLEQVAEFYSNEIPQHIFAQISHQMGCYYNTALIVVEANKGGAVLSKLVNDLAYENIYYDITKGKKQTPGVKVSQTNRPWILEALKHRLINGSIKVNSRRLVTELNTFRYNPNSKKAEARKGKHDDAIMAISIGLFIRDTQMRGLPVGAEIPKEMLETLKGEVYEEIKKEIREGSPEDWIEDEAEDPLFFPSDEEVMPGVYFNIKRKNDKLLREFGW